MFKKYHQLSFFLGLLASTVAIDTISRDGLFIQIGSGYYFIEHRLEKNWFDAYESCRRMGSELITIDTIEEWDAINNYLKDMQIMRRYWTSGTDLAEHGRHVWFSNGAQITQNIWFKGEPDSYLGLEHCDELGFGSSTNVNIMPSLNDIDCESLRSYICEASPLRGPPIV